MSECKTINCQTCGLAVTETFVEQKCPRCQAIIESKFVCGSCHNCSETSIDIETKNTKKSLLDTFMSKVFKRN